MKTIVITNTMARVWGIGAGKKPEHPELSLTPGAHKVDLDVWNEIKKYKQVAAMIKNGDLEEGETADGDIEALPAKPTAAIKLVKETLDVKVLRGWLEGEARAPVKLTIEQQIEKVGGKRGGGE